MTKSPSKTSVLKCVSAEVGRKLPADPDELRQVLRDAVDVCTSQEPEPTKYVPPVRKVVTRIFSPSDPKMADYKPAETWEEFVRRNDSQIAKHTAEIKEWVSGIADAKQREKKFKDEVRQYKIDITDIYSKLPTKEEFYSREYWHDPKRGRHPASGSGRLPSKEFAQIEIREVGGEQAIRIYNPWTKEEIYYYDLDQMDEAKERFKNLYDETFGIEAEPTYRPRQPPTGSGLQMQASLEGGGGQTHFAGGSPQRRGKIAAKRTPRKREKKGSGSLAMFGVMPEGQTTLQDPEPIKRMTLRRFVREYYDAEPPKRIIYGGKDYTKKSAEILNNKLGQSWKVVPSPYTKGRYVVVKMSKEEPFEMYYQKYKDELGIIYRQKYM